MSQLIPFQLAFRQELPEVEGNIDYTMFREMLERLDEIIVLGNLECKITDHLIKEAEMMKAREAKAVGNPIKRLRKKEIEQTQKIAREALRCELDPIVRTTNSKKEI